MNSATQTPKPTATARVIGEGGLCATAEGWNLDIRLPWYRSLPVSTIEIDSLAVDGVAIDLDRVQFELEGRRLSVQAMAEQCELVWYVLDSAYLHFPAPTQAEGAHDITLTLNLYPPYIRGLKRMTRETQRLTPQPASAA